VPTQQIPDLARPGLTDDPEWHRTAVFYEVMLRAFSDSTGAGAGDLNGLIGRLEYLQWLGVDCLWLPPFYPSPMRDGGYDVSDFTAIAMQYGTLADFARLMAEAHDRGMRVIIDMVMNHTSDAHPWFQASRADPDGPYGDFYVWSDDPTRYRELVASLRASDYFLVSADFDSYFDAQRRVDDHWHNPAAWWKSAVLNTANVAWFSSDRTIAEYAEEIWNVPVKRSPAHG
jgi:glycosidase